MKTDLTIKQIKLIENKMLNLSEQIKKLLPTNKCEYCDCYDGIHKTDCPFIIRFF